MCTPGDRWLAYLTPADVHGGYIAELCPSMSGGNHNESTGKKVEVVYGHVMRREEHYVGRRDMVMKVQGRRKRGRPERRWLDKVEDDIKENGLSADGVYDRATWRRMSSYIVPT